MEKTYAILIILTLIAKGFAFARDMALASNYGVSSVSDAYMLATTIPLSIFTIMASSINANYIPLYHKIKKNDGSFRANEFTSNIFNIYLLIVVVLVICIIAEPKIPIKFFASGLDAESIELAARYLRITSITLVVSLIIGLYKNFLQANENYMAQIFAGIPMNIIIFIGVIISVGSDSIYMIYAFVIGAFAQLLVYVPALIKAEYKYYAIINMDKYSKYFFLLSFPVFLQSVFMETSNVIAKNIASHYQSGGLSALGYAKQVENLVYAFTISMVIMLAFPKISKAHASDEKDRLHEIADKGILITLLLTIPIFGVLYFNNQNVIGLIYGRGRFGAEEIAVTSALIKYASIGMIFLGINQVIVRMFYVEGDTKMPLILYFATMVFQISIYYLILFNFNMGIGSVTLSLSVAYGLTTFLGLSIYKSRYKYEFKHHCLVIFLKIIACTTVMVQVNAHLYDNYYIDSIESLKLIFTSIMVYCLLITLLFRKNLIWLLKF